MAAILVVVACVAFKQSIRMQFPEHDHMIQQLKIESRSKIRYFGAVSYGKALRSCWATYSAVGLKVIAK